MINKKSLLLSAAIVLMLVVPSCRGNHIRDAIAAQLEHYQESRVQDIYKNFCQDYLGPGHLIPNKEAARNYLLSEIEEYRQDLELGLYEKPEVRYIPVGDRGNYVRVDLSVVLDSLVDADLLLDAFVRSANDAIVSEDDWRAKWAEVESAIRRYFPDIQNEAQDLAIIDSLMAEGYIIFHHSDAFSQSYHPHYRIVSQQIFKEEIKDKLLHR